MSSPGSSIVAGSDTVLVQTTADGITTITINRPKKRNAVDSPTAVALYNAFRAFEDDPQQKIAILTGSQDTFCAGYDLTTVQPSTSSAAEVQAQSQGPMGPSRLQLSKPVIAAVAGHAVAGGLELSLLADLRVAEEGAIFGVFCRRWGVPLIDGGTVRLPMVVGLGRALDMILTGRPVEAQEAFQMGLVNRIVPPGKSLEAAEALAHELLRFPSECMKADRNNAYYGAFDAPSFLDAMNNEYRNGLKVVDQEAVRGAAAFSSGSGRHGGFGDLSKSKL
jgi:enoyl-CoA hydratase/carnithine racemase